MSSRRYNIIALSLDGLTVLAVLASVLWLYFGPGGVLAIGGIHAFQYFTVDSNVLLGGVALLLVPFDILILNGKMEKIPNLAFMIFHAGVVGTTITMMTVILFLGPTMGYPFMYANANSFLHLVNPVLGLVRYFFFSKKAEKVKWIYSITGSIPFLIYSIFYVINVAVHNGYGDTNYDWYLFGAGGPGGMAISASIMFVLCVSGSVGLYLAWSAIQKALYKNEG